MVEKKSKIKKRHSRENEVIRLKKVDKYYVLGDEKIKAVDDVDITIRKGDFIAIVGPSGSGKCVTGETEIISKEGIPMQIRDIEYKKNLKVFGVDKKKGKIKGFNISNFHKREVDKTLKIKTSSGKEISVTEEHPFFTINEKGFSEISARELNKGIFIASPRRISVRGERQSLNTLQTLSSDKTLIIANSINLLRKIKKQLKISRKEICEKLSINPGTYDCWFKKNNISLYNFQRILNHYNKNVEDYQKEISLTGHCSGCVVKVPIQTNKELLELYGFLIGDGNLDEHGAKITNIDEDLRKRIKYLVRKTFNVNPTEMGKRIDINKSVVRSFFVNVFDFPLVKKSWSVKVPDFVFKCTDEEIAGFIRGLFDCDGYVSNNKREASITLASKELIKQLQTLFLRFGIHTRYSEKIKYASNTKEKIRRTYYNLSIPGYDNLNLFKEKIGFNSKFKYKRLCGHLKNSHQNTNIDVIPCGSFIRTLRRESKIPIPKKIHKLLWSYEIKKVNPSIERLREIIKLFKKNGIDAKELESISKMEIFWDKIISIEKINKKTEVFDITVPGADNFLANGFIIHNSTMMNLIGALDFATNGDIYLDNLNIEHLHESELAQVRGRKIGFVFQTFNLIPTLTAIENVMLPMLFQGIPFEERDDRARELLEKLGMGHRLKNLPGQLSGGERQRVALARALANNPEVILADEPTGNLDSKRGEEVADMFNKLSAEGKTIILVTHDDDIAKHADKIYRLKDGRIVNK